jgi:hypothetical protein
MELGMRAAFESLAAVEQLGLYTMSLVGLLSRSVQTLVCKAQLTDR